MKERCFCGLLAMLLLLLTACVQNPNATTAPSGSIATTDPIETAAPDTYGYKVVEKPENIPTTGWIYAKDVGVAPFACSEEGYFFLIDSSFLCFLDTDSGYSAILCSKAGCKHNKETKATSCEAYVPGIVDIMFYQDEMIYYAAMDLEYGWQLYGRNPDGTGLRKITTLGSRYFSQNTAANLGSWAVDDDYLYYTVSVDGIKEIDGVYTSSNLFSALVRLNLANGKEEELFRVDDELIFVKGVHEGKVLLWMRYHSEEEAADLENYQEYLKKYPACLRLWSEETCGVSTLCEMDTVQNQQLIGFANGKLYYGNTDAGILNEYDFASGVFGKSELSQEITRMWAERYAAVKMKGYYDLQTGVYHENGYNNIQLPAGITSFGVALHDIGETGLIFQEYYSSDHVVQFSNYAYVPFEALSDGMQLSDRLIFMRWDESSYELIQPEG